ncbi:hypothetical protein KHQ81_06365 [Mycoplasmatota bacterium]|nr:hypothetical protein KHQ81_06365 [Mycoplasmatota bacterium]
MLTVIKQLSEHELLSKSVIYRELEDLLTDINDEDKMKIINLYIEVYLKKDYETLIGVAQSAREYLTDLIDNGKEISYFNYETLFSDYHGVGEWY